LKPTDIEAGDFNFTVIAESSISGTADITKAFKTYGFGFYTIGYTLSNPDSLQLNLSTYVGAQPMSNYGIEFRQSSYNLFSNGEPISSDYIFYYDLPVGNAYIIVSLH